MIELHVEGETGAHAKKGRELLRSPPKLMGELPLQFVRSQPSLGYSGLLNKLAARVGL